MTIRILPKDEWGKLATIPEFWKGLESPSVLPPMRGADLQIVAAEGPGEEMLGCLMVVPVALLEGWWVSPAVKGNAGITRGLLRSAFRLAAGIGPWALYGASHETMASRFGSLPYPEKIYVVGLSADGQPKGGI